MLAPWVLYRQATTAVTLLGHTENKLKKNMNPEWCFEAHRESSFINLFDLHCHYIVYTRSTKSQTSWEFTITPFSENSKNSQLKLCCFRPLFLVMKKQSRVYHKKASTPTNQNIILFILPQISGTRVRLSYPPQVGASKISFFWGGWWDEEGS